MPGGRVDMDGFQEVTNCQSIPRFQHQIESFIVFAFILSTFITAFILRR